MRLLIINNLASGLHEGAIYDFIRVFAREGDDIELRSTSGVRRIEDMLDGAEAFDAVVASGGDGTLSAVAYGLRYTGVPILPFPAGTANLTADNLDLPNEVHALAKLLREGTAIDFDLGEMVIDGKTIGFTMIAGMGFDAAIMKDAASMKSWLGTWAYYQAAINNAFHPALHFTLDVDGNTVKFNGLGVMGMNFATLQGGIAIAHENRPRDGMLDVALLKAGSAFGLLPALGAAMLDADGAYPDRPGTLEFYRAKELTITCEKPLYVQYDGDVIGNAETCTIRILPSATRYFVPESSLTRFDGGRE
ncbi:MAG: NAD(+)/NADH kinase [Eggerthellaceae bacterium]|nr:NAD(+)/NADH kinase [Eggerthellaceae bacterium]